MKRDSLIDVVWALEESLDELLEHLNYCSDDPDEIRSFHRTAIELVKEIRERVSH